MTSATVQIVNAFVDGERGGNPAGVVLNGQDYSAEIKQRIAARLGLSEIAFLSPSPVADFNLEFFTPTRPIPHCGHATIATFTYLNQLGRLDKLVVSRETVDGNQDVFIRDGMAFMGQATPRYSPLGDGLDGVTTEAVLASLGLTTDDLLPQAEVGPVVVNNGVNGLMIPLRDEATLLKIRPDFGAIEAISRRLDLVEFYAFSLETRVKGRDAATRMFAPAYGIPEEAATGMAAGQLAAYLYEFLGLKKNRMVIEQGYLMQPPSPSELIVDIESEGGHVSRTLVGGQAKVMDTRVVELD